MWIIWNWGLANHEFQIKFSDASWISIRFLETVLTVDWSGMAFLERALNATFTKRHNWNGVFLHLKKGNAIQGKSITWLVNSTLNFTLRFVRYRLTVFRVKFNVKFPRQLMNFPKVWKRGVSRNVTYQIKSPKTTSVWRVTVEFVLPPDILNQQVRDSSDNRAADKAFEWPMPNCQQKYVHSLTSRYPFWHALARNK